MKAKLVRESLFSNRNVFHPFLDYIISELSEAEVPKRIIDIVKKCGAYSAPMDHFMFDYPRFNIEDFDASHTMFDELDFDDPAISEVDIKVGIVNIARAILEEHIAEGTFNDEMDLPYGKTPNLSKYLNMIPKDTRDYMEQKRFS